MLLIVTGACAGGRRGACASAFAAADAADVGDAGACVARTVFFHLRTAGAARPCLAKRIAKRLSRRF